MSLNDLDVAWLDGADGAQHPVRGNCSFGRAETNSVVLDSPKVSRRHAIIHLQNMDEFWLIDLGSSNGTFLNRKRLQHPIRLTDRDQVRIGDAEFVFRLSASDMERRKTMVSDLTLRNVEDVNCWLLVADIEEFTPLSQTLESSQLATLVGQWIADCKEAIESEDGLIDKYLGDGFLAYWREDDTSAFQVAVAVAKLRRLQKKRNPRFRLVLHYGAVAIGGVPSMGEESLLGREINFVFRLEKVAGSLRELCGMSGAAHEMMNQYFEATCSGEFDLKGFNGRHRFFAVTRCMPDLFECLARGGECD